jgi:tellurite resistance protein TerC
MRYVRFLKYALALILIMIGLKIALARVLVVPTELALAVIAGLLGTAVLASLLFPTRVAGPPVDDSRPPG